MSQRVPFWTLAIALLVSTLALTGCGGDSRSRPAAAQPPELRTDSSDATFVDRVSYCWDPSLSPQEAKVQVLLDASGSMVGFESEMRRLVDWMRKGVSQLMGPMIQVPRKGFTQAHFSQQQGFYNQTNWNESPPTFDAGGNTNLHEAIQRSTQADLTLILTDGVAATGSGGSGSCPGGVDAACVADMMRDVTHGTTSDAANRGVWVVPLVSKYEGRFYSERLPSSNGFDAKDVVNQVESEMGGSVSVQGVGTDSQGKLTYDYRGPRSLALIVLAKDPTIGRATVHALWDNARVLGFQRVEGLDGAQGSTDPSVIRPIEVYPGFVNQTTWSSLRRVDDPNQFQPPIDVSMNTVNGTPTVRMQCVPEKAGYGLYRLMGNPTGTSGSCTQLHVLPGFTFRLQSAGRSQRTDLRSVLRAYRRPEEGEEMSTVDIQLTCEADASLPACEDPLPARWVAYTDYGEGADCLESEDCAENQHRLVREVSTVQPAQQPHRIYGFDRLLTLFYRQVSRDERRTTLAPLQFCMDGR